MLMAVLLGWAGLFSEEAHAFPEMIRHGYGQCTACHYSPSGGGLMTEYGRDLSREILSWQGLGDIEVIEDESLFLWFLPPNETFSLGGDFRVLQVIRDTPAISEGRFILMQMDIEAAINLGEQLTAVGMLGLTPKDMIGRNLEGDLISRRHYLIYRPRNELWLRAGKFFPSYGINTAEHSLLIRRGLGFQDFAQATESYNFEASYFGKKLSFQAAYGFGRSRTDSVTGREQKLEKGVTLNSSYYFNKTYRAGLSYHRGTTDTSGRHIVGPYGHFGFTHALTLVTELDFQFREAGEGVERSQNGIANYIKVDYEFIQGFHGYINQQFVRVDFASSASAAKSFGLGVQIFPRPHFEFQAEFSQYKRAIDPSFSSLFQLLMHFYP